MAEDIYKQFGMQAPERRTSKIASILEGVKPAEKPISTTPQVSDTGAFESAGQAIKWNTLNTDKGRINYLKKQGYRDDQILKPNESPTGEYAIYDPTQNTIHPLVAKGDIGGRLAGAVPIGLKAGAMGAGALIGGALTVPTAGIINPVTGSAIGAGLEETAEQALSKAEGLEEFQPKEIAMETATGAVGAMIPGSSQPLRAIPSAIRTGSMTPIKTGISKWGATMMGKEAEKVIAKNVAKKGAENIEDIAKGVIKSNKVTGQQALSKGLGIPDHVADEAMTLTKKGTKVMPKKIEQAGELLDEADRVFVKAYDKVAQENRVNFAKELRKVGIKKGTKLNAIPLTEELSGAVNTLKSYGIKDEALKPVTSKINEIVQSKNEVVYRDILNLKKTYGKRLSSAVKSGNYDEMETAIQTLKAIRSAEEKIIPKLKEIKPRYAKGLRAEEEFERLNRELAKAEEGIGEGTLTGATKIMKMGNEKTGVGRLRSMKDISEYMQSRPAIAKYDPMPKTIKALLKTSFEKNKKGGIIEGLKGFDIAKPMTWINPISSMTPETKTGLALGAVEKFPSFGKYLERPVSEKMAGYFPKATALMPSLMPGQISGIPAVSQYGAGLESIREIMKPKMEELKIPERTPMQKMEEMRKKPASKEDVILANYPDKVKRNPRIREIASKYGKYEQMLMDRGGA